MENITVCLYALPYHTQVYTFYIVYWKPSRARRDFCVFYAFFMDMHYTYFKHIGMPLGKSEQF